MRSSRGGLVFLLVLGVMLGGGSVFAGTQATCRFVGPGMAADVSPGSFIYLQNGRARVDLKVQPWNASLLYDRSTGVLTVLDHVMKTYDDYGTMKRMMIRGALPVALRANDARLKNGPEIDKQLRDEVAQGIKTVFATKFQKTASNRKVDRFVADLYEAKKWNVVLSAATVSQAKAMPDKQDWETWKEFISVLLETGRSGFIYFGADEAGLDSWPGFQGFPVSLSWRERAKTVYRFQVVKLENKGLDNGLFAPPTDYKEQSILDLLRGQ